MLATSARARGALRGDRLQEHGRQKRGDTLATGGRMGARIAGSEEIDRGSTEQLARLWKGIIRGYANKHIVQLSRPKNIALLV